MLKGHPLEPPEEGGYRDHDKTLQMTEIHNIKQSCGDILGTCYVNEVTYVMCKYIYIYICTVVIPTNGIGDSFAFVRGKSRSEERHPPPQTPLYTIRCAPWSRPLVWLESLRSVLSASLTSEVSNGLSSIITLGEH